MSATRSKGVGGGQKLLIFVAVAAGLLASALERSAPRTAAAGPGVTTTGASAEPPEVLAESPAHIPARGWWQIMRRVVARFSNHRIMTEAAGVTFFGLLALFPALAAFVSLYGFVADPSALADKLNTLRDVIPAGGIQIITDELHALAGGSRSALGFGVVVGLATSLWSANAGIKAVFDALNVVYDETEKRSFLQRTVLSLCFTLGCILFLILALVAVVALPVALGLIGLGGVTDLLLRVARWPLLIVLLTLMLAMVYRYGPSREQARWRWVTWGGALATLLWIAGSALFSWYVAHFGSFNRTYGSLGAVAGFMTWIWISAMVVLSGAELDAELERRIVPLPSAKAHVHL